LNGLGGEATLYQDDASKNNVVINCDVNGGVKEGVTGLAVWREFETSPPR
jgi:hypothetical protein